MRGLDRLQQLRRDGLKPSLVFLDMPGLGLSSGITLEGQLVVEPTDSPATTDLRALHNLCVIAMGKSGDFERVEAWGRAAIRAGAKDVGVGVYLNDGGTDGPVWIHRGGETLA